MNPLRKHLTTPIRQWLTDYRLAKTARQSISKRGHAYVGFWEPEGTDHWFSRFLQRPAFSSKTESQKVYFLSVFCRRRLIRLLDPRFPKVFFTGEHLANYPAWADHGAGDVDLALGFAQLAADNYLRFPLWLLDIFPPEADLADVEARLATLNAASGDFATRPGFAALIARHDNNGLRGELADLLAGYGQVDYPGRFRNNLPKGLEAGYTSKLRFLRRYHYNVCPENTDAPGYVTEKIWHAIEAGCIPVYWGSGNSPEPDILNPAAMLTYSPAAPQQLAQRLTALSASPADQIAFAHQNRFLPGAASVIHQYFVQLETALLEIL